MTTDTTPAQPEKKPKWPWVLIVVAIIVPFIALVLVVLVLAGLLFFRAQRAPAPQPVQVIAPPPTESVSAPPVAPQPVAQPALASDPAADAFLRLTTVLLDAQTDPTPAKLKNAIAQIDAFTAKHPGFQPGLLKMQKEALQEALQDASSGAAAP